MCVFQKWVCTVSTWHTNTSAVYKAYCTGFVIIWMFDIPHTWHEKGNINNVTPSRRWLIYNVWLRRILSGSVRWIWQINRLVPIHHCRQYVILKLQWVFAVDNSLELWMIVEVNPWENEDQQRQTIKNWSKARVSCIFLNWWILNLTQWAVSCGSAGLAVLKMVARLLSCACM